MLAVRTAARPLKRLAVLSSLLLAGGLPAATAEALPRITSYEFEDGRLEGGAEARSPQQQSARPPAYDYEGVSGRYVAGLGSATLAVDVPYDGYYPVDVHYVNEGGSAATLTVTASASADREDPYGRQRLTLPVTKSRWGGYLSTVLVREVETEPAMTYLRAGRNHVTFARTSGDEGEVKLDRITFTDPDPARSGNLLENAGFESGDIAGWREWHPDGQTRAFGVDTADAHGGTYKLWFYRSVPFRQSVHQTVVPATSSTQQVGAWVRLRTYGGAAPRTARMEVAVPGRPDVHVDIPAAEGWHYVAAVVSPGAPSIDVGFYLDAAGGTSLQVDDVRVAPLLRNGSFEDGLAGWREWRPDGDPLGLAVVGDDTADGEQSLEFFAPSRGIPVRYVTQSVHQDLGDVPDGRYTVSAAVKLTFAPDRVPEAARLEVADHGGPAVFTDVRPYNGQGWTRVSATVDVTSGRIDVGAYLSSRNHQESSPVLLLDDVRIVPAS